MNSSLPDSSAGFPGMDKWHKSSLPVDQASFNEANNKKGKESEQTLPNPMNLSNDPLLKKTKIKASVIDKESVKGTIKTTLPKLPLLESQTKPAAASNVTVDPKHIKQVSRLFTSSRVLRQHSIDNPLTPNTSSSDNANDVYLVDFQKMKNLEYSDKEHLANVVFKPGIAAAIRAEISDKMMKTFDWLSNTITAVKPAKATVISRSDHGVKRTRVYCPNANKEYLIKSDYFENKFELLTPKKNTDGSISGKIGKKPAKLIPIDDSPGFYRLKSQNSEGVVMQISSSPCTSIDNWVQSKAEWIIVTDGIEDDSPSFLVPINEAIPVVVDENELISSSSSSDDNDLTSGKDIANYRKRLVEINHTDYSLDVENGKISLYPIEETGDNFLNQNPTELATNYRILNHVDEDGQASEFLVPKGSLFAWREIDNPTVIFEGKEYEVELGDEDGTFIITSSQDENKKSYFLLNEEDEENLFNDDTILKKHGQDYVVRNHQDYQVVTENNKIHVIGKNINGLCQLKIENIFQRPAGSDRSLNILVRTKEKNDYKMRDEFFKRIDKSRYIQAFIAGILLRSEDCKLADLEESNLLFQAMPAKETGSNGKPLIDPSNPGCPLATLIIDLDETWPSRNDYIADSSQGKVHAVREGKLALPQAREVLTDNDKILATNCLKDIVQKKDFSCNLLKRYVVIGDESFTEENVEAYKQIVDRIEEFLKVKENDDWSLQDLFFSIFPEYKEQWEALGDIPPEYKAMYIGNFSVESSKRDYERQFLPRNKAS